MRKTTILPAGADCLGRQPPDPRLPACHGNIHFFQPVTVQGNGQIPMAANSRCFLGASLQHRPHLGGLEHAGHTKPANGRPPGSNKTLGVHARPRRPGCEMGGEGLHNTRKCRITDRPLIGGPPPSWFAVLSGIRPSRLRQPQHHVRWQIVERTGGAGCQHRFRVNLAAVGAAVPCAFALAGRLSALAWKNDHRPPLARHQRFQGRPPSRRPFVPVLISICPDNRRRPNSAQQQLVGSFKFLSPPRGFPPMATITTTPNTGPLRCSLSNNHRCCPPDLDAKREVEGRAHGLTSVPGKAPFADAKAVIRQIFVPVEQ